MSVTSLGSPLPFVASSDRMEAPSRLLLLAEIRALLELGSGLATMPALLRAPRGDGHDVLVLPGFMASDTSTGLLRGYLGRLGYTAHAWNLGRNLGGVYGMRDKLRQRLAEVHARQGRKVSLIGWSLGGVYARDLALSMPEAVRSVITLGSPFSGDLNATNAGGLYEFMSGESAKDAKPEDLAALRGDLAMPTTAIYTRNDGVVHWRTCMLRENHQSENIEVYASHIGLGVNPAVLWAIADRLAQPEGEFSAFTRQGPFGIGYPG